MLRAEIGIEMDPVEAEAVQRALAPETEAGRFGDRISITCDSGSLRLILEAEDIGDLRAALNSYLRWVDMARRIYGQEESK